MAETMMIEAEGLTKRYGQTQALAGVSLRSQLEPSSGSSAPTAPARPPRCAS